MKTLIITLMIVGIIFIAIGYINTNQNCPPPIVQYRYIPRTFDEEQNNQLPILSVYGKMFDNPTPWQNNAGYANNFDTNLIKSYKSPYAQSPYMR